ncbi:AAA family ATPase, partial [Georgenia sp. 10Sc9-8]|nr:AAA family ATPase [Georgenia halotolerans]
TTAAHTLADAVSGTFHRIQCTPDLMPNDIVGTQIFNYATGEFTTQLGPVHANVLLLDEINRSSAKTQSAMLEAMQERQTSIGGEIYPLPRPFVVLATQNPIEEEGTYVLPEAQMDRFLLKEVLTYPTPQEEVEVLDRVGHGPGAAPAPSPISLDDVGFLQELSRRVYVDASVKQYIVALVNTTRGGGPRPVPGLREHVRVGASPRGAIALMQAAQAVAVQHGRTYVVPDDVKTLRHAVLRHRLVRTYDALAADVAPEALVDAVFAAVPAP